jgi:hypothetical protein
MKIKSQVLPKLLFEELPDAFITFKYLISPFNLKVSWALLDNLVQLR